MVPTHLIIYFILFPQRRQRSPSSGSWGRGRRRGALPSWRAWYIIIYSIPSPRGARDLQVLVPGGGAGGGAPCSAGVRGDGRRPSHRPLLDQGRATPAPRPQHHRQAHQPVLVGQYTQKNLSEILCYRNLILSKSYLIKI